ncbi:MAG: hypothetical protein IJ129_00475 [Ruminococcus sp.]|nr:hypothetical protein [Ruminococcus sp.]
MKKTVILSLLAAVMLTGCGGTDMEDSSKVSSKADSSSSQNESEKEDSKSDSSSEEESEKEDSSSQGKKISKPWTPIGRYTYKSKLMSANSNAKTIYNALMTYIADTEAETGKTPAVESFELDFTEGSDSEVGRYILHLCGDYITEGTAFIGLTDSEYAWDNYFIQYQKNSETPIGQYPSPISYDSSGNEVWGEFLDQEFVQNQ